MITLNKTLAVYALVHIQTVFDLVCDVMSVMQPSIMEHNGIILKEKLDRFASIQEKHNGISFEHNFLMPNFNAVIHTIVTIFHKWRESGCATAEKRFCACVDIPILITSTILYNSFILQFVFPVVFHISDFLSTRCDSREENQGTVYVRPLRNHQCFMQGEHPTLQ